MKVPMAAEWHLAICRAFHLQALSLFRDAAEYDSWLKAIRAPVLAIAGDEDNLTPMVRCLPMTSFVTLLSYCESEFA